MPARGSVAISLNDARTIVEAALQHARSGQYPPMTVAVTSSSRHNTLMPSRSAASKPGKSRPHARRPRARRRPEAPPRDFAPRTHS
jgi:hypothetical protein